MLSPFNLLLITAGFSIVMLFVLASLMRSRIPGLQEWTTANSIAVLALLMFAGRGAIPNFISIDIANALAGTSICITYLGFRRYFGLPLPIKPILSSLAILTALIMLFHYGHDSIGIRTVVVSTFFSIICLLISTTVFRWSHLQSALSPYPYRFTAWVTLLFAIGHACRGLVYWSGTDQLVSTMQASSWNLLFLSLGTLMQPVLTMGAIMMVHDRMMAKAVEDANHDFLTGAWSRRAFFEFTERELARATRLKRPLSLLVFDVDYFKQINDAQGHATGDNVLIDIVERARLEIRSIDYIARMGGDEFSILLPEADAEAASAIAERVRSRLSGGTSLTISSAREAFVHATPSYTVSIGVATRLNDENMADLMHRADMALYEAKAKGRNAVASATMATQAA
ncbi:GGDEF domain-containing protein [uncultured Oxalicibacterium sp.]|uniref:GGDEF domain-containing protein n=1 Tax=uncultured Oxalicibacterium sp. TaxID=1168540 RepID=UPI0025CCC17F|nr:GGDEF domain-containing protein [uncultured Oxalicibacterium sp.]